MDDEHRVTGRIRTPRRGRAAALLALLVALLLGGWLCFWWLGPAAPSPVRPGDPSCPAGAPGCRCDANWACVAPAACYRDYCYGGTVPLPNSYLYTRPMDEDYKLLARLILSRLELAPGMRIADVGAGRHGTYTFPMAASVGPSGRVYATDLDPEAIRGLREGQVRKAARGAPLAPIDLRLVEEPRDTALDDLEPASLDRVLMINVFGFQAAQHDQNLPFLKKFFDLLKPGGRLIYHQDWTWPLELGRDGAVSLFVAAGFASAKVSEVPMPEHMPAEADWYDRGPALPPVRVKRGYILVFEK